MNSAPILSAEEIAVAQERAAAVVYIGERIQAVATAVSAGKFTEAEGALLRAHYETLAADIEQGLHVDGGDR